VGAGVLPAVDPPPHPASIEAAKIIAQLNRKILFIALRSNRCICGKVYRDILHTRLYRCSMWHEWIKSSLTLGVYPGVMLSVLAYKLAPNVYPSLAHVVLALNLASLITALLSGGLFFLFSIALWTHASWLVANTADIIAMDRTVGWKSIAPSAADN
jgi:hypothetical protein